MNEMIERVARAIARARFQRKKWTGACSKDDRITCLVDTYWEQYVSDARAALVALRPLDGNEMIFMKGGNVPVSNRGKDHLGKMRTGRRIGDMAAHDAWETMIDAILAEAKELQP